MEVPRTSSGKTCKLCIAKGAPCHLHGGTPKKLSSNTKSGSFGSALGKFDSPKKRDSREWLDQYKGLPQPALYQVLLNVDREELHYICTRSKQALKICRTTRFREEYESKNPSGLIVGKLKMVKKLVRPPDPAYPGFGGTRLEFVDEGENEIGIAYENGIITYVHYIKTIEWKIKHGHRDSRKKRFDINLIQKGSLNERMPVDKDMNVSVRWFGTDLDSVLKLIGKEKWKSHILVSPEGRPYADEHLAKEIWKILRSHLIKAEPEIKNLKWRN